MAFAPLRSCHDAIAASFVIIAHKAKYVLDADLKGAFDNINHVALLKKLNTYPAMSQAVRAWLKAGIIDKGVFEETTQGTPQGGVASPLFMNIALHGMETALMKAYRTKADRPQLVRYADDLVVFHPTAAGVKKAKEVLEAWLADMGLELKPSKTRITHTLQEYQGTTGFDFLGFTIRQVPVGKTHTGRANQYGPPLGFKTLIKPSKEAVKRHIAEMKTGIKRTRGASQGKLIKELNPVIRGWTNYDRTVAATETFNSCGHVLYLQLRAWANFRHPNKSRQWIAHQYWHVDDGAGWIFKDQKSGTVWEHPRTHIQRHVKVRGTASPYDGNLVDWNKRLRNHSMFNGMLGKLLHTQQGKCRWCERYFRDGDQIEIDHLLPKSLGGGEELSNKFALHRHCHDARHASVNGTYDKGHIVEELDDAKVSCPVLQTSESGDTPA
jgi:RNA-directed DNA polymerase